MKVSLVIPNFNGRHLLEKNLPSVIAATQGLGETEIIVVDDGSTDDSVEFLKDSFPQVKVLAKEKNEGFSSAVNLGVKNAKGEIIVLLNTDIVPSKDFLSFLLPHFADPEIFAVGCLDESVEKGKIVLRGRGIGWWQRGFLVHQRGEVQKTNTLWVSGGSGAFRKSLWEKLGGLDEIYNPFYWEDIDLSYRVQKSGFKILFEPKSKVIHKHEEGVIKSKFSPNQVKKIAFRNQFFFVWKNATDPQIIFAHLLWLPYYLIKALLALDAPFIFGFLAALTKLPQVLKSRQQVKKLFVKSDRRVVKNHHE